MTRNLKALGLALVVALVMGALTAGGVSAHEFHADGERAAVTGVDTNDHEFTIGSAGVLKCTQVATESQQKGSLVSANTYASDTFTKVIRFNGCTFGGQPATVNFEHCALVLDSDTSAGNTTGGEHANLEIECSIGLIELRFSFCTVTVPAQTISRAVRYENDPSNKNAINIIMTGHGIEVGNLGDKPGCALIPKGKVGKYVGNTTETCFRDDGSELSGTSKTTPQTLISEGPETECKIA